jgi:hypothetical protein
MLNRDELLKATEEYLTQHNAIKDLKITLFKGRGYCIAEYVVDGRQYKTIDMKMKSAFTLDGSYIGNSKWAYRLWKRGIKPEYRTEHSRTCSIGFCEAEQKWYGWSHRAIYGFGIGSTVKKGDCGYAPANREDYIEGLRRWYSDRLDVEIIVHDDPNSVRVKEEYEYPKLDVGVPNEYGQHDPSDGDKEAFPGVLVRKEVVGPYIEVCCVIEQKQRNAKGKLTQKTIPIRRSVIHPIDIEYGRGEWAAQNLDEAKEMAIAFAESVS